jgi:hypothetical protein
VLARDENENERAITQRVTRCWVHEGESTVRLHLDNGEVLRTTLVHRFFAEGKGFVGLGQLTAGDRVRTVDGGSAAITQIITEQEPTTVYNLSVDRFPTYFVGRTGVWVHNEKEEQHALEAAANSLQTALQAVRFAQRRIAQQGAPAAQRPPIGPKPPARK